MGHKVVEVAVGAPDFACRTLAKNINPEVMHIYACTTSKEGLSSSFTAYVLLLHLARIKTGKIPSGGKKTL